MQKNHTGKILAVGIIVLFKGVGIHPGFATDIQQSLQNENNEENCGCEELKTSNLVSSNFILKRVRKMVNRIDSLFGHYPEIADICKNITQILDGQKNPILCWIFVGLWGSWLFFSVTVLKILTDLGLEGTKLWNSIYTALGVIWIGLMYSMLEFCSPYYIKNVKPFEDIK